MVTESRETVAVIAPRAFLLFMVNDRVDRDFPMSKAPVTRETKSAKWFRRRNKACAAYIRTRDLRRRELIKRWEDAQTGEFIGVPMYTKYLAFGGDSIVSDAVSEFDGIAKMIVEVSACPTS